MIKLRLGVRGPLQVILLASSASQKGSSKRGGNESTESAHRLPGRESQDQGVRSTLGGKFRLPSSGPKTVAKRAP